MRCVALLQDIARLTLAALQSDACKNRTLTLAGPSAYTTREVIDMCESMSDSRAQVTSVPTWLLRATRNVLKSADWARDAADRLVSALGWDLWACWVAQQWPCLGCCKGSDNGAQQSGIWHLRSMQTGKADCLVGVCVRGGVTPGILWWRTALRLELVSCSGRLLVCMQSREGWLPCMAAAVYDNDSFSEVTARLRSCTSSPAECANSKSAFTAALVPVKSMH